MGALVQGTFGFGIGLVAVPVLGALAPGRMPQTVLPVSLPLLLGMLRRERLHLDIHGLPWLLSGRLLGVVPGLALVSATTGAVLQMVLAVVTMSGVILLAQRRLRVPASRTGPFTVGTASGIMATTSGLGGPPLVLLHSGERPATLRSMIAAVFLAGNVLRLGSLAVVGRLGVADVVLAATLAPAVLVGLLASGPAIRRLDTPGVRVAMLSLVFMAAMVLFHQGYRAR